MSGELFLVMRGDGEVFETLGPKATTFDSFDAADKYARKMLDQHTGQRFVVCQAVSAYEIEQVRSVKMLGDETKQTAKEAGASGNVVGMPSRQAS